MTIPFHDNNMGVGITFEYRNDRVVRNVVPCRNQTGNQKSTACMRVVVWAGLRGRPR
jgi:hypothetical protein